MSLKTRFDELDPKQKKNFRKSRPLTRLPDSLKFPHHRTNKDGPCREVMENQ